MDNHKKPESDQEPSCEKTSFLIQVVDKKHLERKLDVLLRVQTEKYKNILEGVAHFKIRVDLVRSTSTSFEDRDLQHFRLPVMEARCEAETWSRLVSFSDGYVVVDPPQLRGLHIGTYILNLLIEWAIANFPNYGVIPITLSKGDARNPKNIKRRHLFYDKFGFRIIYDDATQVTGHSPEDLLVSQLSARTSWKDNIVIIDETEHLRVLHNELADVQLKLKEREVTIENLRSSLSKMRKSTHQLNKKRTFILISIALIAGAWMGRSILI